MRIRSRVALYDTSGQRERHPESVSTLDEGVPIQLSIVSIAMQVLVLDRPKRNRVDALFLSAKFGIVVSESGPVFTWYWIPSIHVFTRAHRAASQRACSEPRHALSTALYRSGQEVTLYTLRFSNTWAWGFHACSGSLVFFSLCVGFASSLRQVEGIWHVQSRDSHCCPQLPLLHILLLE